MTNFLASIPSPAQGVWDIGPVPVRAYALFIALGIVVGVLWGNRRWVARGGRPGTVTDVAMWAVPFGIVGGRLYHVITDAHRYFGDGKNPMDVFAIWNGGLGIWGAIALGALGAWIGCRRYGVSFPAMADSLAPAIIVAQAIGRIGNWFNQELFGSPTTLPWGLEVYYRTADGGPVQDMASNNCQFSPDFVKASPEVLCGTYHPTFLYEMLWGLAVAALLVWADRRFRLGGGRVFALYVAGYTLGRIWIEALRIDPATEVFGIRINIFTSAIVFIGAVAFLVLRRTPREDPSELIPAAERTQAHAAVEGDSAEDGAETAADGDLLVKTDVEADGDVLVESDPESAADEAVDEPGAPSAGGKDSETITQRDPEDPQGPAGVDTPR